MANVKRVVIPLTAAGLIAAMGIGGAAIAAYLTDSETTTNTFTVGNVKMELEEPHWPGNGSAEVTDIEPNKEIPKDPQVENTGNNPLVSFLKVYSPVALVNIVNTDLSTNPVTVTKSGLSPQEIFLMKDANAAFDANVNSFHTGADHEWDDLTTLEGETYVQAQTQTDGTTLYAPINAENAAIALWKAKFYTMKTSSTSPDMVKMESISAEEAAKLPIAEVYTIESAADFATAQTASPTFEFAGTTAPAQFVALTGDDTVQKRLDDARIYKTYVFGRKDEVDPHEITETIFDKVQFKNIIEGELDGRSENIIIDTYGIQSQNVLAAEGDSSVDTTALTTEQLDKIYKLFIAQGTAGQGDEAQSDVYKNVQENNAIDSHEMDLDGDMLAGATKKTMDVSIANAMPKAGTTSQITVNRFVNGDASTDGTVTYASSNSAVATVSAAGLVTAVAPGDADITVTWGDVSYVQHVQVMAPAAVTP